MSMRLFRRKSGTRSTASDGAAAPTAKDTSATKTPSRTRRTESAVAKPDKIETPPAVEAPADVTGAPQRSRTRRGRRGGARRNKSATDTAGATRSTSTTPARPVAAAPALPEPRASRDGKPPSVEQLLETQLQVLRSVQGSLAAIESRLGNLPRAGSSASRLGIFVDVPNIVYAAERMKITLDYAKLLQFVLRGRELVRANAYSPISDDPQEPLAGQKFVHPFIGIGYSLVTKPLKRYNDGSIKANFDVEMAIDILTMCDRLDTVVLVSGDSDFRRVVELVASKGVRVEVAAFGDSTSMEIRAAADEYIDLKEHLTELRAK